MATDHYDQTCLETILIDEIQVDLVGYQAPDAPDGEFEWFDLFDCDSGECLNEGDPFHFRPDADSVRDYVRSELA